MDNPISNNDENKWVDDRIANLTAPPGWKPNADEAFERVMRRRPSSGSRGLRLAMAGATLAVIGLVVTMLPWHMLWTPKEKTTTTPTELAASPVPAVPEPAAQQSTEQVEIQKYQAATQES